MTRGLLRILLLSLLALGQTSAHANMAAPWDVGDPVGEPVGALRDLHIKGEQLLLDFTPLAEADNKLVQVRAVYEIENKGTTQNPELLFLGVAMEGTRASLDGKELPLGVQKLQSFPPNWAPPKEILDLDGQSRRAEFNSEPDSVAFTPSITPGLHRLEVTYSSRPFAYHPSGQAYRRYHFAYLLGPAKAWASFSGLELEVLLPPSFEMKANLDLVGGPDRWSGHFPKLPGDVITVSVAHRAPDFDARWPLAGVCSALALMVTFLGARGPVVGFFLGVILCPSAVLGSQALFRNLLASDQLSRSWSYAAATGTLGLAFWALVVGGLLGLAVGWRRRKSAGA